MSCQILGISLENKVILKLILSKNINNKKCANNLYSSMKKHQEDLDDFLTYKIDFESQMWEHLTITPIHKIQ